MPLLHSSVKLATKHMPKVISPTAHAVLDYATAAAFFASLPCRARSPFQSIADAPRAAARQNR